MKQKILGWDPRLLHLQFCWHTKKMKQKILGWDPKAGQLGRTLRWSPKSKGEWKI